MTDLEKRYHNVMGSLLGNESLASSLDEDAAAELFSWCEAAAKRIVDETDGMGDELADEQMTPRLRALRLMIRAIGRWVGEAHSLDAESKLALWNRVGDQARILFGESFALPSMDETLAQLPAGAKANQMIIWLRTFIEEKGNKE